VMEARAIPALMLLLLSSGAAWLGELQEGPSDSGAAPAIRAELEQPGVAPGESGPARFAGRLYDAFDVESAMKTVRFTDGFYRAPGNEGYNATLEHVEARLRAAGFGEHPGLELEVLETELRGRAWTPRSASLELLSGDEEPRLLHGFSTPDGADRVMLPINAPSAEVEGGVGFDLETLEAGQLLLTRGGLDGRTLRAARKRGAVAVLSSSVNDFTVDPRGGEEHLDAILFSSVSASNSLPVAKISARTAQQISELAESGVDVRLRLKAEVSWSEGPLRTLVATVVGRELPSEAVAIAAHVQEPGAGDNASGVGGVTEGACEVARLLRAGELEAPARSVVFLFGDEMRQSAIWLEATELRPVAGISADMLGQSYAETGAICLLERSPDPGALDTLAPDQHTPWGAGRTSEERLIPNGLALIARTAQHDIARHVGGWRFSENPWEGGSDHDIFLGKGVPGVLLWHFTDFTYHTGLDRLSRLDPEELRRTACTVLASAMAIADLRRGDLARYLASDELELVVRTRAAEAAARPDVARRWRDWSTGVRAWFEASCVERD
jgi:aminopeptidase YwaD